MNASKFALSLGRFAAGIVVCLLPLSIGFSAVPGDEHWDNQFGPVGANNTLTAVAVNGVNVYIGGNLTAAGNVRANLIAGFDGTNWYALNNGLTAATGVNALTMDGTNLYVGGGFDKADGVDAKSIARWDGANWFPVGLNIVAQHRIHGATHVLGEQTPFSLSSPAILSRQHRAQLFSELVVRLERMQNYTSLALLALLASSLAGCSTKSAGIADARLAADMNTITNVIVKHGAIYKKAEAGELGPQASFHIVIGTNSDQRHYILTWKESKWQVTPTNQ